MAAMDAIVLGAGIVGTCVALHLVRRGLSVALIDRRGPGEGTSYGNAGVISVETVYPAAFPRQASKLMQVALKRAPEANFHWSFLPRVAPWLLAFAAASKPERLAATARMIRPLFSHALAEHEALMEEAGAARYLRKTGWLAIYRSETALSGLEAELDVARELGLAPQVTDVDGAHALEPHLAPVFRHALLWPHVASVSNPLALTQSYASHFAALGGAILTGDARSLRRANGHWRVDTAEGEIAASEAVVALGPWAPDVLRPLGVNLPLAIKRGYHRHFRPRGNSGLTRPVLDAEIGYVLAPMEQGIRITTGAEFAPRDAPPSPAQFARLMPSARALFPLGKAVEPEPWMGSRPVFADSRPVIGRAPRQPGLWLAYGHGHWGLTLGPVTGRLMAEMMTGATPVVDPAPYGAERFH